MTMRLLKLDDGKHKVVKLDELVSEIKQRHGVATITDYVPTNYEVITERGSASLEDHLKGIDAAIGHILSRL